MEGCLGVIAFVDGLQKVGEFSGGFVEGSFWVCEGFIGSLVEAYEGSHPCGSVVRVYRVFARRF